MAQLFSNLSRGELAAPLAATDTALTLSAGDGAAFPAADAGAGTWFKVVLQDADAFEIAYVYGHGAGLDAFSSVLRGQEGTQAQAFAAGATVGLRVLASDMAAALTRVAASLRMMVPVFTSRTWTVPVSGVAIIRCMAAGGSGAVDSTANAPVTGGYSGSWALKTLRVTKGQQFTFVIGAGGAALAQNQANGNAGGATSVAVDGGAAHSTPGGPGGVRSAAGTAPSLAAGPVSGDSWWDLAVASAPPLALTVAPYATNGAGVDILAQGGNATSGGGTGAGTAASPGGYNAAGAPAGSTADTTAMWTPHGDWGISFFGGAAGSAIGMRGGNGASGYADAGSYGGMGGNGAGGAFSGGASGQGNGAGGIGGAGGGSRTYNAAVPLGAGGNGYACVELFPDINV